MSTSKKIITLKSSDNEFFEVEEDVARVSEFIKGMIEDDCVDTAIPVSGVQGKILVKIIEYCKKHVKTNVVVEAVDNDDKTVNNNKEEDEELEKWDAEFVKVDTETLFNLTMAANYLNISGLLDLTTQTVANLIKDKTVEEIREFFNLKNDFTPEEEAEIRKEYAWVFDNEP